MSVSVRPANPIENRLLAALPNDEFERLFPRLQEVSFSLGEVVYEFGGHLDYVYFPTTAIVSLLYTMENGATAEMATVGREGVVGIGTLPGGEHALGRYLVALPGFGFAVEACRFQDALRENSELRTVCESYAQAFLANLLQNVACNACHQVEQRFARWLLMCDDQADDAAFELTHEYLAEMLGVRRSTVTVVAGSLQNAGLIRYHRGAITVVDRRRLETVACECYRIVHDRYERSLIHAVA